MLPIPAASGVGLQALLATPSGLHTNGIIPRATTAALGTLVPLYCSLRALAHRAPPSSLADALEDRAELRGWLQYWTAFGWFKVVEVFGDKLIFWLPYYVQLKWFTLLWLQLPIRSGCVFVTENFLIPFYSKHLERHDERFRYFARALAGLIEMQIIEMEVIYRKIKYLLQQAWRSAGGPNPDAF